MNLIGALALLGLLFGGFRGLVIGALLGFGVRWLLQGVVRGGLQQSQAGFLDATFAVMGAVSKADGVVSRDEIASAVRSGRCRCCSRSPARKSAPMKTATTAQCTMPSRPCPCPTP